MRDWEEQIKTFSTCLCLMNRCSDKALAFYSQKFYCTYSKKCSWKRSASREQTRCPSVIINYTRTPIKETATEFISTTMVFNNLAPGARSVLGFGIQTCSHVPLPPSTAPESVMSGIKTASKKPIIHICKWSLLCQNASFFFFFYSLPFVFLVLLY